MEWHIFQKDKRKTIFEWYIIKRMKEKWQRDMAEPFSLNIYKVQVFLYKYALC